MNIRFLDALADLVGVCEEDIHTTDYEGKAYITPPMIESDDRKEDE